MQANQTRYQCGKENFFESTHGGYQGLHWLATTSSENWERRFTVNNPYQNSFSLYNDPSCNLFPQERSPSDNEFGSLAHAWPNFEFSVNYHLHVNRPGVDSSTVLLQNQEVSSTDVRKHTDSRKYLEELFKQKCLDRSLKDSPERVTSLCPSNFDDQNHQIISNSCRFSPMLTPSPLPSTNSSYSSLQQLQSQDQHKFHDEAVEFVQRGRKVSQVRSKKVGTRSNEHYRKVYTKEQKQLLEEAYKLNAFLEDKNKKEELSIKTGLQPQQVKVWFQNRRSKEKRERITT